MKLSKAAITRINTPAIRRELSRVLDCTEQSIIRYIHRNKENGLLTTAGSLEVIRKETGLNDGEILVSEPVKIKGSKGIINS